MSFRQKDSLSSLLSFITVMFCWLCMLQILTWYGIMGYSGCGLPFYVTFEMLKAQVRERGGGRPRITSSGLSARESRICGKVILAKIFASVCCLRALNFNCSCRYRSALVLFSSTNVFLFSRCEMCWGPFLSLPSNFLFVEPNFSICLLARRELSFHDRCRSIVYLFLLASLFLGISPFFCLL